MDHVQPQKCGILPAGLATVVARHTFGHAINKESAEVQGNPGQAQEHQNIGQMQEDQKL